MKAKRLAMLVSATAMILAASGMLNAQAFGWVDSSVPSLTLNDNGDSALVKWFTNKVTNEITGGNGKVQAYADCWEGGFWTVPRWGSAPIGGVGTKSTAQCLFGGTAAGGWGWLN